MNPLLTFAPVKEETENVYSYHVVSTSFRLLYDVECGVLYVNIDGSFHKKYTKTLTYNQFLKIGRDYLRIQINSTSKN